MGAGGCFCRFLCPPWDREPGSQCLWLGSTGSGGPQVRQKAWEHCLMLCQPGTLALEVKAALVIAPSLEDVTKRLAGVTVVSWVCDGSGMCHRL